MELLSVVITTHNRELSLLRRALDSVRAQSWPALEILIVDDSDPDYLGRAENRALVASLDGKPFPLRYIPHDRCMGLSAARNTGLAGSRGDYVAFLDDDDEWLPKKSSRQLAAFRECVGEEAPVLVYSGGYSEDDRTGERRRMPSVRRRGAVFGELLRGNWIGPPSFVTFRKAALVEAGAFDPAIPFMEDWDLYLRLAKRGPVSCTRGALAVYHDHSGDQMTDHLLDYISGLEYLSEKYAEELRDHPTAALRQREKLALALAEAGELDRALALLTPVADGFRARLRRTHLWREALRLAKKGRS